MNVIQQWRQEIELLGFISRHFAMEDYFTQGTSKSNNKHLLTLSSNKCFFQNYSSTTRVFFTIFAYSHNRLS